MGKLLRVSILLWLMLPEMIMYIVKTTCIKTRKIIESQNILILKGWPLRNKLRWNYEYTGRKYTQRGMPTKSKLVFSTKKWLWMTSMHKGGWNRNCITNHRTSLVIYQSKCLLQGCALKLSWWFLAALIKHNDDGPSWWKCWIGLRDSKGWCPGWLSKHMITLSWSSSCELTPHKQETENRLVMMWGLCSSKPASVTYLLQYDHTSQSFRSSSIIWWQSIQIYRTWGAFSHKPRLSNIWLP